MPGQFVGVIPRPTDWRQNATATAAITNSVRSAPPAGSTHHLQHVLASYDDATQAGTLTIDPGGSNFVIVEFVGHIELNFGSAPIRCNKGAGIQVSLTAGGVGVLGRVNLLGYTLPD